MRDRGRLALRESTPNPAYVHIPLPHDCNRRAHRNQVHFLTRLRESAAPANRPGSRPRQLPYAGALYRPHRPARNIAAALLRTTAEYRDLGVFPALS